MRTSYRQNRQHIIVLGFADDVTVTRGPRHYDSYVICVILYQQLQLQLIQ